MKQSRMPVFAERFLQLRGQLSQEEFAKKVGLSRPTVSFYESGERLPDALKLRQIAEQCHVSADWLIGLSDVKTTDTQTRVVCEYTGLDEELVENLHYDDDKRAHFISGLISEIVLTSRWHHAYVAMEKAAVACAISNVEGDIEIGVADALNSLLSKDSDSIRVGSSDCIDYFESVACKILQEAVRQTVLERVEEQSQIYTTLRKLCKDGEIWPMKEEDL